MFQTSGLFYFYFKLYNMIYLFRLTRDLLNINRARKGKHSVLIRVPARTHFFKMLRCFHEKLALVEIDKNIYDVFTEPTDFIVSIVLGICTR